MLRNYVTIAIRNIIKNKVFSFVNIFGLALGMSVCIGIIMLVADQMMIDRHNQNASRIFRITTTPFWKELRGAPGKEFATTALPLHAELLSYSGIERSVRLIRGFGNHWLEVEPGHDINVPLSGFFADPEIFSVFGYQLKYGDATSALNEPFTVVLTERAAERMFEEENPIGETIKVGSLGIYTVTGVIKDTGERSHIVSDGFASISSVPSLEKAGTLTESIDKWDTFTQGWIYILLRDGKSINEIHRHLEMISQQHYDDNDPDKTVLTFGTQNLLEILPGRLLNNPIGPFMPWIIVYFLAGLAGIVLITSCFNFTNLSMARSLTRAREIGVRKVTGASRVQLFLQFLSESVLVSIVALIIAVGIIYAIRPLLIDLAFARFLHLDLSANAFVYGILFVFAVIVGILAGLFPAAVLSGLQPVKVLKNLNNTKLFTKVTLRKTLLVIQFAVAMIFILTVIVMYNQLNMFIHHDYGFIKENRLIVHKGETSFKSFKTELLRKPNIVSVTAVSHLPLAGVVFGNDFKKDKDSEEVQNLNYFSVDESYLDNMGLHLVAGEYFSTTYGESNSNFIVLNEQAVQDFNLGTPVEALGKSLFFMSDSTEKQIIGVVKNYQHELFAERMTGLGLLYNPDEFRLVQIAYSGGFTEAKRSIEQAWNLVNPGLKVEVKDFESEIGKLFDIVFGTLIKVLVFVSFLAITISCLGLLGMATYTVESRRREIALRKVLGSSNKSLVFALSKDYLALLFFSLVIAVPVSYYLNTFWLESLAYHVSFDVFTVAAGALVLALFGIFTIGSQTAQAIWIKPVDNLKSE